MAVATSASRTRLGTSARLIHHRPILVCGAPRTATSWTAKVLSFAGNVRYIREPLSHGGYTAGAGLDGFEYLLADDDAPNYEAVWCKVLSLDPFLGRRWLMAQSQRWLHRLPVWPARLLIKEVNCPLALEWLAKRFGFQIVVTLRHPCGYVASGMRLESVGHEVINLDLLLAQPRLMSEFSPADQDWIRNLKDPVARMAAGFGMVYRIIANQLPHHPEWTTVCHETTCDAPHKNFEQLCDRLGLKANRRMREFLDTSTVTHDADLYSLNRISAQQPAKWKSELSSQQIDTVASVIERFKLPFYRDFA